MDGERFDQWTKALATGTDRRRVMRTLLGAVAAVGLGARQAATGAQGGGRKGPDPCAVFCADQPGPRGAQCRQTCKACNSEVARLCHDPVSYQFSCCAAGSCCLEGTCQSGQATLTECGGRCNDEDAPLETVVNACGETVSCPPCSACATLGCGVGYDGEDRVTGVRHTYCVDTDPTGTGSCLDSPAECPEGSACFGLACREICTGA